MMSQPLPQKNGGPSSAPLTGSYNGRSETLCHQIHHLIPVFSGNTVALSFLARNGVMMSLRGIWIQRAHCLVVVTSSWLLLMTWKSIRWPYTTSICFMSLRKSRKWNTSSRPSLSSDGNIRVLLSNWWWRCGTLVGEVTTTTSFAIKRYGEIGFSWCAKLWCTGMALMTWTGVISLACGV